VSIADSPILDKSALIGRCARLRASCDPVRLAAEVAALPAHYWGSSGGRTGPQASAQAVFLRGHAPAEGRLPIEDREALAHLPYVREIITSLIPASPSRCLLALLPAGQVVSPHVDDGKILVRTIRLHVPVVTSARVWMFCDDRSYCMRPGEIWALNNSAMHGVWNADSALGRVHLICDFHPSSGLLDMLAGAQRDLGEANAAVRQRLFGT
jgi:hypothetical protein